MNETKKPVAIVTGAGRGIGKACAKSLAQSGFTVIINYGRSKQEADATVREIIEEGGDAFSYQCNVSNYEEVKAMVEAVHNQYGSIDVLVNNAGITRDNLVLKMTEQEFDDVIQTNLKGVFNTTKHVARYMLKQRSGRIVNISSVVGIKGNTGQTNYASAKAGVIGLTKALARELASRNITVNAIAPGFIQTDMTKALPEAVAETMKIQIPLKRFGKPEDIADMVTYLATNEGNYITGQVFVVDGGLAM